MKPEEIEWCSAIHEKIKQSVTYRHVFRPDLAIASARSMNEIEDLLHQGKYLTIFDWSLDINMLVEELVEYYSGQRYLMLIACDFSAWFEKRLMKKAVTKEEIAEKTRRKGAEKIRLVAETYDNFTKMLAGDKSIFSEGRKKSGQHSNKKKVSPEELQAMQKAINEIKDDSVLLGVMRILKKWMPDTEIAEDTVVDVTKLPKQCVSELMVLLGQL